MFYNLRKSDTFQGNWWAFEVTDANGVMHTMDGIWGMTEEYVIPKAEEIAAQWASFDAPAPEELERQTEALVADMAIWGCE